jgi:hypothetical protein
VSAATVFNISLSFSIQNARILFSDDKQHQIHTLKPEKNNKEA